MTDATNPSTENGAQFVIQKIYLKDTSFEAPESPHIFRKEWEPQVEIDLQVTTDTLETNTYEVQLNLTITAKTAETTAFLVEVYTAGIFTISGIPNTQLESTLRGFCPSILYPYAREMVSNLVSRGGFPPLYLAPVNFDALYEDSLRQQEEQAQRIELPN